MQIPDVPPHSQVLLNYYFYKLLINYLNYFPKKLCFGKYLYHIIIKKKNFPNELFEWDKFPT